MACKLYPYAINNYNDNYVTQYIERDRLSPKIKIDFLLFTKWLWQTMYPKASADVKISTFFEEKWGEEVVDHEIDLKCKSETC